MILSNETEQELVNIKDSLLLLKPKWDTDIDIEVIHRQYQNELTRKKEEEKKEKEREKKKKEEEERKIRDRRERTKKRRKTLWTRLGSRLWKKNAKVSRTTHLSFISAFVYLH